VYETTVTCVTLYKATDLVCYFTMSIVVYQFISPIYCVILFTILDTAE